MPHHRTTLHSVLTLKMATRYPLSVLNVENAILTAYHLGSRLGMSSFAQPCPCTPTSPQTSLHTKTKYVNTAGSLSAAWLMYDTAFRFMAATNTNMPWAKGNEQLYNDILKEETLPYCIHCHMYGHRTLACTLRPKSAQSFRPYPTTFTATAANLPQPSRCPASSSNCQLSVATSTAVSVAAPTVNSSTFATNLIAEAATLVPSALKHLKCNSTATSLDPPSTPVNIVFLSAELKHHPDEQFIASLIHDLQWGCNIGYAGPRSARITPNLKSAYLHPDAV